MDTSKERIEALKKCKKLQDWAFKAENSHKLSWGKDGCFIDGSVIGWNRNRKLWLPRIDQHLAILKEKGRFYELGRYSDNEFIVDIFSKNEELFVHETEKSFEARTLERALDKTVEMVLNQEEK